jgi:hypothetical protein
LDVTSPKGKALVEFVGTRARPNDTLVRFAVFDAMRIEEVVDARPDGGAARAAACPVDYVLRGASTPGPFDVLLTEEHGALVWSVRPGRLRIGDDRCAARFRAGAAQP